MEPAFVALQLSATNERLRRAQEHLDAAVQAGLAHGSSVGQLERASGNLGEARLCIDEISRRIESEALAAPATRDCPSCGRSMRAEATLCGYCWKRP
jgi:hypothetical protein